MKYFILLFFVMANIFAQNKPLDSKVYDWKELNSRSNRILVEGTTKDLALLRVEAAMILLNDSITLNTDKDEKMILIKEGNLEIQLKDNSWFLGPGSLAYIMPEEDFRIINSENDTAILYLLTFKANKPADMNRSDSAGGSFMINMADLEFKPHDKGGIRNYYRDRPTAMFGFTEMHVTTLNPAIKSHEPHTHSAAEIVLMISGNTEMQIEDSTYSAKAGDLYYLESNVLHAISNVGDKPCMYFAIQWE